MYKGSAAFIRVSPFYLSQGGEKLVAAVGGALGEVAAVEEWDGDDGQPPEEEFSLADLERDEL